MGGAAARIAAGSGGNGRASRSPALAAWLGSRVGPVLATWRNRERRAGLEEQLQALTQGGYLALMLQALDDPVGRTADAREASEAVLELARTDFEPSASG